MNFWSAILAILISFGAALSVMPISQTPGQAQPSYDRLIATQAVHSAQLTELLEAKLQERVATLEADQRRQDALQQELKATVEWIRGILIAILLTNGVGYWGLSRKIVKPEPTPSRKH